MYIRKPRRVTSAFSAPIGQEPSVPGILGGHTPTPLPSSLTHRSIRVGRFEGVAGIPADASGVRLDPRSVRAETVDDFQI
jgi:hypothetical protein